MRFDGPLLSPRTPTRALPPIKTGAQQVRCCLGRPCAPSASARSSDQGGRQAFRADRASQHWVPDSGGGGGGRPLPTVCVHGTSFLH
jgi:hypothetical protein